MALTEEMRKYHRDWYHNRSAEQKRKKIEVQNEHRRKILMKVAEYKSSIGCACGEKDWRCLDFHHTGKKFLIYLILSANALE